MEAAREHCCAELTEEGELLCGVPPNYLITSLNVSKI
jgi:hypothetical protein